MRKVFSLVLVIIALTLQTGFAREDVIKQWEEWCAEQTDATLEFARAKIDEELARRKSNNAESSQGQSEESLQEEKTILKEKSFNDVTIKITDIYTQVQSSDICLVVEYQWSHSKDEAVAFAYTITDEAYQDGVQLVPYTL